eukprot:COSAG04_NODE_1664_length_6014_cov_7.936422_9_plen_115_part_00
MKDMAAQLSKLLVVASLTRHEDLLPHEVNVAPAACPGDDVVQHTEAEVAVLVVLAGRGDQAAVPLDTNTSQWTSGHRSHSIRKSDERSDLRKSFQQKTPWCGGTRMVSSKGGRG